MKQIKPPPYTTRRTTAFDAEAARFYRERFVPLIRRRMKSHHLAGFRQSFIVDTVAENKRRFPYFLRTDIRLYYPNMELQLERFSNQLDRMLDLLKKQIKLLEQ